MAKKENDVITGTEKEFMDRFNKLTMRRSDWQVWSDLMAVMACSIANIFDPNTDRKTKREEEYSSCMERLEDEEIPAQMLAVVTNALENNPEQDFLGQMFMNLNLGSHWKGQFFTPFHVSQMMAQINLPEDTVKKEIENRGWISVNDPACGAGSMLIAAASVLKKNGINYQQNVAIIANDIDRVAAQMCYIQLSILGCPGYVVVADTLTDPVTGSVLFPEEKTTQEFWYTPMWWCSEAWTLRRLSYVMDALTCKNKEEHYKFYFDFGDVSNSQLMDDDYKKAV